ncbi:Phosphatidate cytidylyltransferase [Raoultella planticola]|uniref:Phosphatidate cytidylyltransferase n=1 Tax=Raoultella planticola TaxID=575 RepID=A0A485B0K1_RAOPL|nr:Phosphatidate cytidylyltransferase [Raoultella planticola]
MAAVRDDFWSGARIPGAYMFGKMFGKHKLAPKVSPGKTWPGFFGGLVTAAVISWAYGQWANLDVTPTVLLVCSVVAALASVPGRSDREYV